jgi:hypothetical protein
LGRIQGNFVGSAADFSRALQTSFRRALSQVANARFKIELMEDDMASFHRHCSVHFIRSLLHVMKNKAVISLGEESKFRSLVTQLTNVPYGEFYTFVGLVKKFLKLFPKAANFLKWHVNPVQARNLFPACQSFSDEQQKQFAQISKDTNAQESVASSGKPTNSNQMPNSLTPFSTCPLAGHGFFEGCCRTWSSLCRTSGQSYCFKLSRTNDHDQPCD